MTGVEEVIRNKGIGSEKNCRVGNYGEESGG